MGRAQRMPLLTGGRDLGEVIQEKALNYQCLAQPMEAGGREGSV
jgi:hypothetical protein